jgi:hypothetical protein
MEIRSSDLFKHWASGWKIGAVVKVDETSRMVTPVVDIFNRETSVDIDFSRLVDAETLDTAVGEF